MMSWLPWTRWRSTQKETYRQPPTMLPMLSRFNDDRHARHQDDQCIMQDGLSGSLGSCSSTTTTMMGNETASTLLDSECITPSNCWMMDVNSVIKSKTNKT